MGIEPSDDERKKRIKEEEHRREKVKAFQSYLIIKNFLVEYLYGNKTISSKDNLEVYLIKTSSIPKFIKIIKEVFKTVKSETDLKEAEDNLKERLEDYQIEKKVEIYDSYQPCLDIIKNNSGNEFIIVREDFINNFEIDDGENKKVQIIEIDKNNHSIKVKFLASQQILNLEEIKGQRGYFQFSEIKEKTLVKQSEEESKVSGTIISQPEEESKVSGTIISTSSYNDADLWKLNLPSEIMNKDYKLKKDELYKSMSESIIYCLLNIKSFNDKFMNTNNMTKDKAFSMKFYKLISQKQNKNALINCSDLIDSMKSLFIDESVIPLGNIYKMLHEELKQIDQNQNYMIITQDINKLDYQKELMNVSNEFKRKGTSIISDLFYFPDITTIKCQNCGRIFKYESITNNNITFPLKEVSNFKNLPGSLNINDCFDYLTSYKKVNMICPNCNRNNSSYSYYRISSTKEILTIILDRGKNFENDIIFNIHFNVNLSKYFYEQNYPQNYELICFCSFDKDKNKCIPFYKYHVDNLWYYLDNSVINCYTKDKNINFGSPFLLFYKKINNNMNN